MHNRFVLIISVLVMAFVAGLSAQDVSRRLVTKAFYANNASAIVASAATIVPVNAIVHVSGSAAVVTITVPAACAPTCTLTVIPDGLFTWTTGGNISIAGAAVVNKALSFFWDGTKWNPSYLS